MSYFLVFESSTLSLQLVKKGISIYTLLYDKKNSEAEESLYNDDVKKHGSILSKKNCCFSRVSISHYRTKNLLHTVKALERLAQY